MANVPPIKAFKQLGLNIKSIMHTRVILISYTGNELKVLENCQICGKLDGNEHLLQTFVAETDAENG